MGIIVSTLVGCGKEELVENYRGKAKFFDLTNETIIKEVPPKEFVDDIMNNIDDYDIVFIPTESYILEELEKRNIDYDIFYPSKERRQEIVIKLVGSKMPFTTIAKFDNNFYKWVDEIDSRESSNCYKHKMAHEKEFIHNSEPINNFLKNVQDEQEKRVEESSRSEKADEGNEKGT